MFASGSFAPALVRRCSLSVIFRFRRSGHCDGVASLALLAATLAPLRAADETGIFSGRTQLGEHKRPAAVAFDSAKGTYTLGAAGLNIWARRDEFIFVWQKATGDIAFSAAIDFVGQGGDPHRKAGLVVRQALTADSIYVDAAVHGDGLASLQFREAAGALTRKVQARASAPRRMRLDKIGDAIHLSLAGADGAFTPAGSSVRLPFAGEFLCRTRHRCAQCRRLRIRQVFPS